MSESKITIVTLEVIESVDENGESTFYPPSRFYIVNSLGHHVYFRTRSREMAITLCEEEYGKGKYNLRVTHDGQKKGRITAK